MKGKIDYKLRSSSSGITLVALVVTIVILLILATITIGATLKDNGLISKAKLTKMEQLNQEAMEQEKINELVKDYEAGGSASGDANETGGSTTDPGNTNETGGSTTDPGETTDKDTIKYGDTVLKIGDYVNYDCETGASTEYYISPKEKNGCEDQLARLSNYEWGWRVLGLDDEGRLLLIAEDYLTILGGSDLYGRESCMFRIGSSTKIADARTAYLNYSSELNKICNIYGQGKGALEARNMSYDELVKRLDYDTRANGIGKYGQDFKYTRSTSAKVAYSYTNYKTGREVSDSEAISAFTYYNGTSFVTLSVGSSVTIKDNWGNFHTSGNETPSISFGDEPEVCEIDVNGRLFEVLFKNSMTGSMRDDKKGRAAGMRYYLTGNFVACGAGSVGYCYMAASDGAVAGNDICNTKRRV